MSKELVSVNLSSVSDTNAITRNCFQVEVKLGNLVGGSCVSQDTPLFFAFPKLPLRKLYSRRWVFHYFLLNSSGENCLERCISQRVLDPVKGKTLIKQTCLSHFGVCFLEVSISSLQTKLRSQTLAVFSGILHEKIDKTHPEVKLILKGLNFGVS